jgi:hypothetical protein
MRLGESRRLGPSLLTAIRLYDRNTAGGGGGGVSRVGRRERERESIYKYGR